MVDPINNNGDRAYGTTHREPLKLLIGLVVLQGRSSFRYWSRLTCPARDSPDTTTGGELIVRHLGSQ
jgi:hypothetical protein